LITRTRNLPEPEPFAPPFTRPARRRTDARLVDSISRFARSPKSLAHLDQLRAGRARLFVTGQQPSFPLPLGLTLQKIATAIVLARREPEGVPLFWNGSDDSDFPEAAGQFLVRPEAPALEISLPAAISRKGERVGDLPVEPAFRDLSRFRDLPFMPQADERLGDFHARVLSELFAEEGLLVLDAREPSILQSARPLLKRYAAHRTDLARRLDESGDRIESETGHRPLRPGIGERALFFLKKGRRNLPLPEQYGRALESRIEDPDIRLSCNVALRPLVQDAVLPVQGVVLGPSEWMYHHQIRPAFELFGLSFPRPWPRLDAAGSWEWMRGSPPAGGRRHSPLLEEGSPLGRPEILLELAELHLEAWRENNYYQWIMEEDRE